MILIRGFLVVIIIGAVCTESSAQPVVAPKSVLASLGTVARFNCTASDDQPVFWSTRSFGSQSTLDIYIGERILLDHYGSSGRFSVEVNATSRRYDLVIKDIKHSDGGVYICIDERGLGKKAYAELVVWDTLICQEDDRQDSYMGDNVFGLDQDTIGFTCRMRYNGNIRPHLIWSVGGRKWNGTQGTDSGIASSSLILVATSKLDGANVTVEAVFGGGDSSVDTGTQVLWTSDIIRVNYAIFQKEGVDECPSIEHTLKCNPPCSYKLEIADDTERCAVSYSTGTSTNWFYFDQSSGAEISEPVLNNSTVIGIMITAACIVLMTAIVALGCLIKKLRNRRKIRTKDVEKKSLKQTEACQPIAEPDA